MSSVTREASTSSNTHGAVLTPQRASFVYLQGKRYRMQVLCQKSPLALPVSSWKTLQDMVQNEPLSSTPLPKKITLNVASLGSDLGSKVLSKAQGEKIKAFFQTLAQNSAQMMKPFSLHLDQTERQPQNKKSSHVVGIKRGFGNQTCWANALLQSVILRDKALEKNIRKKLQESPVGPSTQKLQALVSIYDQYHNAHSNQTLDLDREIQIIFQDLQSQQGNVLGNQDTSAEIARKLLDWLDGIGCNVEHLKLNYTEKNPGHLTRRINGQEIPVSTVVNGKREYVLAEGVRSQKSSTLFYQISTENRGKGPVSIKDRCSKLTIEKIPKERFHIELNRMHQNQFYSLDRTNDVIDLETISLDGTNFSLDAFAVHLGNYAHYISYVKDGDTWMQVNDSQIKSVTKEEALLRARKATSLSYVRSRNL